MPCATTTAGAAGVVAKGLTLLVLGVGAGAAHSVLRPITLRMQETAPTVIPAAPTPSGGAPSSPTPAPGAAPGANPGAVPAPPGQIVLGKYLTLAEAQMLWEQGLAQFVDARHKDEFVLGHIPRSILVDPDEMYAGRVPDELNYVDQMGPLVIYCGGGDCDASENAGRFLQQMGFTQLHIFKDGFPAWQSAGLDVNVGEPGASVPK